MRDMDAEKLLRAVKNHPFLYDLSHPKYMNAKYKTQIWKNIGKDLGFDGPACKSRWTNLRDTYKKFLKKYEQGDKQIKRYKYHHQMEFIRPLLLNESDTIKTFDSDSFDELDTSQTDRESDSKDFNQPTLSSSTYQPRPSTSQSMSKREIFSQPLPSPPLLDSQDSKRLLQICNSKSYSKSIAAPAVSDYIVSSNNKCFETNFKHPVDAFLLGAISPILKSLPPYELALAKSELFALAQKYEFKMANVNLHSPFVTSTDVDQNRASTSNATDAMANVNKVISAMVSISDDQTHTFSTNANLDDANSDD